MKETYWGYWLVLLGVFIVVVMMLVQSASTTNTQDYYQLKEVANAAVYDAIDTSYYSQFGEIRINKELFVANFIKRFAQTVSLTDSYQIDFYDLYESPPKVSVKVSTKTGSFMIADEQTSLDVVNSIDLIVELGGSALYCTDEDGNIKRECPYDESSDPDKYPSVLKQNKCWYYN